LLLVNFIVLVVLVVLVETLWTRILTPRNSGMPLMIETASQEYTQKDQKLGFRPIPGVETQVTKRIGNELLYSVSYGFDEFGRRITPQAKNLKTKKFAVFVGDSNTFGEGVENNQTLPFYFSKAMPEMRIYNYAFRGYGPNNVLALLQTSRLIDEVPETEGLVIYPFKLFQARRLLGTLRFFSWANGEHPRYILKNGKLQRKGLFATSQPYWTRFKRFLSKTQLSRLMVEDKNQFLKGSSFDLLCASFVEMKAQVRRLKPQAQFVVSFSLSSPKKVVEIITNQCFTPNKITWVDFLSLGLKGEDIARIHQQDLHYAASAHKQMAEALAKALKNHAR
jgi:hypothetical protein